MPKQLILECGFVRRSRNKFQENSLFALIMSTDLITTLQPSIKLFVEGSLSYNLNKAFKICGLWRYMYDMDEKRQFSTRHRVAGYVRYKKEIGYFDLKVKTMLHYGFDDLSAQNLGKEKLINRNSAGIDYNWFGTKFTPFAEYEFFYSINHINGGIINQSRLKAGSSYCLSKASEISVYYMFENEFNTVSPVDAHIVGVGYSYKI